MIRRFASSFSLALLIGAGGALPAQAQQGLSVQETVLRAKPATVLIISEVPADVTLDCGGGPQSVKPPAFRETGTGWFIDPSGWVITNGHVVQPAHEPPRWLVNQMAERAVARACLPSALKAAGLQPGGDRPDAEAALRRRLLDRVLPTVKVTLTPQVSVVLSSGARLKAEVKKYSPPASTEPGAPSARDLALLKVPQGNYPMLRLSDATVQIGDPIRILGFPGVVLSHELLNQSASVDASMTAGAVSGLKEDKANHPFIQTDASAAFGNSGGPAINAKGELVGVLTFVSLAPGAEGSIVQGFNFAIPAETVKNFVADQLVKINQAGKFNPVWHAGLRDYFTDDWKGAKRKFEEADKLLPGLVDVKRMLAEAAENVKNPPPRPFPWFWVTIGVTLLSAGGYGAQFAIRWHKNRYRVGPSEIIRLAEAGKEPIILDTRQQKQYEQNPIKIRGSIRLSPEDLKSSGPTSVDLDRTRPVVAYCT